MKLLIKEETFNKILDIISDFELIKKNRKHEKIYQRAFLYNYLYTKGMTLQEIGRLFERDHTTILHGLNVYKNMLETDNSQFHFAVLKVTKQLKEDNIFEDPLIHDIHKALSFNDCKMAKNILRILFKNLTGVKHKKVYNLLDDKK
tara:strand:- start:379 stop:816 length:438 start_codon:yes stop_codon:yes gene_type:complete